MSWGGIIAQGIIGAASGAASAGLQDILEKEKQAAVEQRDAKLAALQEGRDIRVHAANLKADAQSKLDNAGPLADAEAAAALRNSDTNAKVKEKNAAAEASGRVTGEKNKPREIDGALYEPETDTFKRPPRRELNEVDQATIREKDASAYAHRERAAAYRDSVDNKASAGGKDKPEPEAKWHANKDGTIETNNATNYTRQWVEGEPAKPARSSGIVNGIGSALGVTDPNVPAKAKTLGHYEYADRSGKQVTADEFESAYTKAASKNRGKPGDDGGGRALDSSTELRPDKVDKNAIPTDEAEFNKKFKGIPAAQIPGAKDSGKLSTDGRKIYILPNGKQAI